MDDKPQAAGVKQGASIFYNESAYFEALDEGYVFRPSIFSGGYAVCPEQKEQLSRGLRAQIRRGTFEALAYVGLIALLFMTGGASGNIPPLLSVSAIGIGLCALTAATLHRRGRLLGPVIRGRTPDVPRLPLAEALKRQRPASDPRAALLSARLTRGLFVLVLLISDALVAGLALFAFLLSRSADPRLAEAAGNVLTNVLGSGLFLGAVAALNLITAIFIVMVSRKIRKLRDRIEGAGG